MTEEIIKVLADLGFELANTFDHDILCFLWHYNPSLSPNNNFVTIELRVNQIARYQWIEATLKIEVLAECKLLWQQHYKDATEIKYLLENNHVFRSYQGIRLAH